MAVGDDRVQVLKQESTALGGDDADVGIYAQPEPIDPQEDALESAGIYFQDSSNRDETTYIGRNGNDMCFKDSNNSELTLSQLSSGALPPATALGQVLISTNGSTFTVQQPAIDDTGFWFTNDDGVLVVIG